MVSTRVRNLPGVQLVTVRSMMTCHLGRPAREVAADHALEERPPALGPVEDAGVGQFELPEGEFVVIGGPQVVVGERRGHRRSAPKEPLTALSPAGHSWPNRGSGGLTHSEASRPYNRD